MKVLGHTFVLLLLFTGLSSILFGGDIKELQPTNLPQYDIECWIITPNHLGNDNIQKTPKTTISDGQQGLIRDLRKRPCPGKSTNEEMLEEGTAVDLKIFKAEDGKRFLDADLRVTKEQYSESNKGDAEICPSNMRKQVKKGKPSGIRLTSTSTRIVEPLQLDKKISVPLDKGRIELRISETPTKAVPSTVAVSRETQSLMMMVDPRIIITGEEEEKMVVSETPTKAIPNTSTSSSSKSGLIMGGVTPRIILVQEEEEGKLGITAAP